MLSLLLQTQKKELKKEYSLRLFTIFTLCILFITIVWIIAIFPSYVLLSSEKEILSERAGIALASEIAEDKRLLLNRFEELDNKMKLFSFVDGYYQPTDIINAITYDQSSAISLFSINLGGLKTEDPSVSINGIATTRESLQEFIAILNSQSIFEKFELPLSDFVKDKDIPFNISLKLKINEK